MIYYTDIELEIISETITESTYLFGLKSITSSKINLDAFGGLPIDITSDDIEENGIIKNLDHPSLKEFIDQKYCSDPSYSDGCNKITNKILIARICIKNMNNWKDILDSLNKKM